MADTAKSVSDVAPLFGAPPEGLNARFVAAEDGTRLRCAWARAHPGAGPAGTVAILNGRTEMIEKYYPVIEAFRSRGHDIVTLDWRGQGLSERVLGDMRGHVTDFAEYRRDLDAALGLAAMEGLAPPRILLGHSMGGCIALHFLLDRPEGIDAALLSAPMIDIRMAVSVRLVAPLVAASFVAGGMGERYAAGCGDRTLKDYPFEDNLLTGDAAIYRGWVELIGAHPELGLGGPSWAWLAAAFKAMDALMQAPENALAVPVLLFACGEDRVVSNAAMHRFAERHETATPVELEGARHEPLFETPAIRARLWAEIDAFLGDLDGGFA